MESKSRAFLNRAIFLILALYTLYLICLNISIAFENKVLVYAIIIIPVYLVVLLIAFKIKLSPLAFAISIFLIAFLAKGIFVTLVDTKPFSDFNIFYENAINLAAGEKSFGNTFYFQTWAYQSGPVIYYSLLIKFFGSGLLPLKLANTFFMAGSNMFIYLISRKISNEYAARFVSILYIFYPAPYFLASVLTNQHFAAFMFLAAIYTLFADKLNIVLRCILSGLLIAVGNAVRPLGVVIVIAIIIWGIIEAIRYKSIIKIGTAVILLIAYMTVNFGISAMVKNAGINSEGLANNFPLWKFVIGFNYDSKGQFSYEDQNKIFYIKDFKQRDKAAMQAIKERLSVGPIKLLKLFNAKQEIMWASDDTLRWEFYKKVDGNLKAGKEVEKYEPYILGTEKIYYILAFILMILGLLKLIGNKNPDTRVTLISILLLCYFGVHVLIEIQVRYRYFAVMLVFILAAAGSEMLFGRHINKRNLAYKA